MKTLSEKLLDGIINEGAKIGTMVKLHQPIGEHKYGVIKGYVKNPDVKVTEAGKMRDIHKAHIVLKKHPCDDTENFTTQLHNNNYTTLKKDEAVKDFNENFHKKGDHVHLIVDGKTIDGHFDKYDEATDKFIVQIGSDYKSFDFKQFTK